MRLPCCTPSGQNDYCGVHTNSGVGNFMFYLLVAGGSGTNDIGNAYSVSAIGLSKADQILYRTNTVYLTPTSGYGAWQQSCISAAADLFGALSNEVAQVKNAWYAVGIGTAPCSPPANVQALNITDNTAQISWTAVAGTSGYTLQWKPAAATTFNTISVSSASYTLTGLTPGTIYTFQVSSACSGSSSSFSAPGAFSTTNTTTGGLSYKYYEGAWNALPDFSMLAPVKTGNSANVDISARTPGRNDNFGFVWEGYINITTPGDYTFETVSDDGSKLYFNSMYNPSAIATVSNDGLHAPGSATGTVNIPAAGTYPISITFFEKDGGEQMQVYWAGPSFARQPIPNSAFTISKSVFTPSDTAQFANGAVSRIDRTGNTGKVQVGKIYPNPFAESINISFFNNSMANDISAGVYDVNGRLVYLQHAGKYAAGNNTLKMDLSGRHMAEGFYLIKIAVNGVVIKTEKLMKAK